MEIEQLINILRVGRPRRAAEWVPSLCNRGLRAARAGDRDQPGAVRGWLTLSGRGRRSDAPSGHQLRIVDVDADAVDLEWYGVRPSPATGSDVTIRTIATVADRWYGAGWRRLASRATHRSSPAAAYLGVRAEVSAPRV